MGKMRLNYCDKKKKEKKKKWPDENTRQSQRTESIVKGKCWTITHRTIFYPPLINSRFSALYTGYSVISNLYVNRSFTRVARTWPIEGHLTAQRLTSWPSKVCICCYIQLILHSDADIASAAPCITWTWLADMNILGPRNGKINRKKDPCLKLPIRIC